MNRLLFLAVVMVAIVAIVECHDDCSKKMKKGIEKCAEHTEKYMKKATHHKEEGKIICCIFNWTADCMSEAIQKSCPELDTRGLKQMLQAATGAVAIETHNCGRSDKESCKPLLKKVGAGAPTIAVPTIMASFLALTVLFLK